MNLTKTNIVSLFFCFFGFNTLLAQDPFFSQFFTSGSYMNPGLIGVFNGSYKLQLQYRDQWSSLLSANAFRTFMASGEYKRSISEGDSWAIHISGITDQAGKLHYKQSAAQIGAAYNKTFSASSFNVGRQGISVGAQLGIGQNSADWTRIWFGRQFDLNRQVLDRNLDSGESFNSTGNDQSDLYYNINVGIFWYSIFDVNKSFYLGGALHHVNEPDISFFHDTNSDGIFLYPKITVHLGGEVPFNDQLSILPSAAVFKQGPSMQINLGSHLRYADSEAEEVAMKLGVYGRIAKTELGSHMDAVVFHFGLGFGSWDLGLSYDITISPLSSFNQSRGAFEIVVSYIGGSDGGYQRSTTCPTF